MNNTILTCDMTKEAVTAAAHKLTAVPSMIILYVIFGISLFLVALGFKDHDSSWGKFAWIWTATMIVVGVFLVFLIFSPSATQWIVTKWSTMWV